MKYKIEYYKDITVINHFTLEEDTINQHFIKEFNTEQEAIDYKTSNNIVSDIVPFEEVPIINYELRIKDLLLNEYKTLHNSKIDFRKHLEQNTQLKNKDVTMSNGRPVEAIYTLNGVNIARIRFEFEFDSIGFISRRKEILGYYNTNDEILEEYVISDEEYGNTEYQLGKKFDESVKTRENVFKNIMTTVNMVLINHYVPLGDTIAQAQKRGSDMYTTYNKEINSWIQTGDGDLNQLIGSDTVYSWLELEVSTGVTIRQLITSKID